MGLHLAAFPSELLGFILSFSSSSYMVLRLWKCGDSLLNSRLARGVTDVEITASDLVSNNLPSLLFSLKSMRHLRVRSNYVLLSSKEQWYSALKQLPSTLETLRFGIATADGHYIPFRRLGFALPETSVTQFDLGALFPGLLDVSLYDGYTLPSTQFSELPSTLTRLHVWYSLIASKSLFVKNLPRTLTELDAHVVVSNMTSAQEAAFRQDWLLVPPQLILLDRMDLSDSKIGSDWIPRGLRIRKLHIGESPAIANLPPKVDALQIHQWMDYKTLSTEPSASDWPSLLPRELKALILSCKSSSSSTLFASNLALLPRTLTKLDLKKNRRVDWSNLGDAVKDDTPQSIDLTSLWPPALTSLRLELPSCQSEVLGLLPRNLRELKVLIRDDGLSEKCLRLPVLALPPMLTSLQLDAKVAGVGFCLEGELPTSLITLKARNRRHTDFSGHSFEALPTGLKDLFWQNSPASFADRLWSLPPTLTRLDTSYWPIDRLGALPRTLTHFSSCVGSSSLTPLEAENVFVELPPALVFLDLSQSGDPSQVLFSSLSFSRLLVLESLLISNNLGLFPACTLRHLSPCIQTLHLPLSSSDIDYLPPTLKRLYFYREVTWNAGIWPLRCSWSWIKDAPAAFLSALDRRKLSLYH